MKLKTKLQLLSMALIVLVLGSCNLSESKTFKNNTNNNINMTTTKEIIVDVRSPEEYEFDGHADCSVNYPLDQIQNKVDELKKFDHVVLVCRSGARAGVAQKQLQNAGVKNIENKGAWQNVICKN